MAATLARTSTRTTPRRLAKHVDDICARAGIAIVSHARGGRSWRKAGKIAIRMVKSDVTYAIALHEIGHVVGPQVRGRLNREVEAWQWAQRHALIWSDAMSATMQRSLGSYVVWALRRQHRERGRPVIPPVDYVLWSMITHPEKGRN
jgi:hypothetical protein